MDIVVNLVCITASIVSQNNNNNNNNLYSYLMKYTHINYNS